MKCVIIYNPHSMKSAIEDNKSLIISKLKTKFNTVEFWGTQYHNHAIKLSRMAANKGFNLIIAAGGDGTLNQTINGIATAVNPPKIGLFPFGTVNDVARSLKISTDLNGALDTILNDKVFYHDLIKVNDNYGFYSSSMGLFTKSTYTAKQKHKKKLGWFAYGLKGVKEFFSSNNLDVKIKFSDHTCSFEKVSFFAVLNSRSMAGFITNKDAVLDDGKVDLIIIKNSKLPVLKNFITLARMTKVFLCNDINRLCSKKYIIVANTPDVEVLNISKSNLNIDGEFAGTPDKIKFKVMKKQIPFLIP